MDYVEAIEAASLAAVVKPDYEAWLRHVRRCYSKWFHTPLHTVSQLPLHDVLVAYYEEAFEQMDDRQRGDCVADLTKTPEEREAEDQKALDLERKDDAFFAKIQKELKEQGERLAGVAQGLQTKQKAEAEAPPVSQAQPTLPVLEPEPAADLPDINMRFSDNLAEEDLLNGDPLATTNRP